MIITNRTSQQTTTQNEIMINGEYIERAEYIKYLGVTIDEHLDFKKHAEELTKKIGKKVNFLGRISNQFDYCASVLFLLNNNELHGLQQLQNKALRIILKRDHYESVNQMLKELKFLMKNGLLPSYLKLETNRKRHNLHLRNNDNLKLPNLNLAFARKNVFYERVALYNSLPIEIRDNTNVNVNRFKREVKKLAISYVT